MDNEPPWDRADIRRRIHRLRERVIREETRLNGAFAMYSTDGFDIDGQSLTSLDPLASMARLERSRTLATPGASHLQRHRLRREVEEGTLGQGIGTVQDAVNRLNEATLSLNSALDDPLPQMISPEAFTMDLAADADAYRRRAKRRKLEDQEQGGLGLRYGHYGSVVPGRLKMLIESCDGGQHESEEGIMAQRYPQENILRNDRSVYCTEKVQCNVILKHMGGTPFTLTKLVIKAPDGCFTAPIQDGLVFVSMTLDGLLSRTSRWNLRAPSPPPQSSTHQAPPPPPPRQAHYFDPPHRTYRSEPQSDPHPVLSSNSPFLITARLSGSSNPDDSPRAPSRRAAYPSATVQSSPSRRLTGLSADNPTSTLSPLAMHLHPPPATRASSRTRGPHMPPATSFHVTTSCDDPSGDEEEESSAETLLDLRRRRNVPALESSDTEEESRHAKERRLRSRAQKFEWQPGGRVESNSHRLDYHAKFFIERKKHVVSVRFEPPVSGRYILFKLWSPVQGSNIDIQTVMAFGYAGPRFFPALKPL